MQARRALSEREIGASFGAFANGLLIADLGIVRCATTAQPERRHRRGAPADAAGLPSPRRCCAVGRRSGLQPMDHRHRGHEPGRTYLPQPGFRTGHRQRPGVPQAAALSRVNPHTPLEARAATVATNGFTTDAGTGEPALNVSTSASISGPVM